MRDPEVLISDAHGSLLCLGAGRMGSHPAHLPQLCFWFSHLYLTWLLPLLFLITRPGFTAAFVDRPQRAPVQLNMPPKSVPPPAFPVSVHSGLPYTKALVRYIRNVHAILHPFL